VSGVEEADLRGSILEEMGMGMGLGVETGGIRSVFNEYEFASNWMFG